MNMENKLPEEVADTKKVVDMYAHDYRDMAMGEDELAVMLYRFANSLEAEQYRAGAALAGKFGWNK